MKNLISFTLLLMTVNIFLHSESNLIKEKNSVELFLEAKQLEMRISNQENQMEEFDFKIYNIIGKKLNQVRTSRSETSFNYNLLMRNQLIKRGITYRLNIENNNTDRGDCDFFDCEDQEACGFESWLGDGICDDGTYGIYYNCDEFDNDAGDCDETGDDGSEVDPCEEIGGTTNWLGDGWCDVSNNNNDCSYDAGDCCPSTCVDGQYDCLTYGGSCDDCIDPSAEDSNGSGSCTDMGDDGGSSDGTDDGGGDCDFFDCEDQEACGFESWLGDGICDDGTYGIYYNCDEFDNDAGDCDEAGDDGGTDGGDGGQEECLEGSVDDCSGDGDCCPESWIGDGFTDCQDQTWGCDMSCYDNDGGDCDETGDDGGTDGGTDGGGDSEVFIMIGETTVIQGDMPSEGIIYGAVAPLFYESSTPIGGIQFIISDSPNWVTGIELSSVIEDCFEANFNDVNGSLMGIFFSLEGCELEASESSTHFANITYEISADAGWGELIELNFQDVIVPDGVGNSLSVNTQGGTISVSLLGDVSSDSEINVIDVVTLVNFILLFDDPSDYQAWAGDVNEDSSLNIIDIVILVDIILER